MSRRFLSTFRLSSLEDLDPRPAGAGVPRTALAGSRRYCLIPRQLPRLVSGASLVRGRAPPPRPLAPARPSPRRGLPAVPSRPIGPVPAAAPWSDTVTPTATHLPRCEDLPRTPLSLTRPPGGRAGAGRGRRRRARKLGGAAPWCSLASLPPTSGLASLRCWALDGGAHGPQPSALGADVRPAARCLPGATVDEHASLTHDLIH